jgi:hypothetical protein
MTITFHLAIPHTPWVPARVESFDRLGAQLGFGPTEHEYIRSLATYTVREPNWSWSGRMWVEAYDTSPAAPSHFLQLQDDVIVGADFWPDLHDIVSACPDEIIGLETAHPVARILGECGEPWCTTSDGLIGVGYVIPMPLLGEFLRWRGGLPAGAIESISEDTLIDVFCIDTGRKVWHPIPTIIDHDVSIASTYGNDRHGHRRPVMSTVQGCKANHSRWKVPKEVWHLGSFYGGRVEQLSAKIGRKVSQPSPGDMCGIIGSQLVGDRPWPLCVMCAKEKPCVHGGTGLGVCKTCLGASVGALLARFE